MQLTSPPSSVSGRKQACVTCRQRKKKCDGKAPACGLCTRIGNICLYSDRMNVQPPGGVSWMMPLYHSTSPSIGSDSTNGASSGYNYRPLTPTSSFGHFAAGGQPSLVSPMNGEVLPPGNGVAPSPPAVDHDPLGHINGVSLGLEDPYGWLTPLGDLAPFAAIPVDLGSRKRPADTQDDPELSLERFKVLLTAFWEHCHVIIPCLHHRRLLTRVGDDFEAFQRSPLFWAIAGCGAWHQKENVDTQRVKWWLQRANDLIDDNIKTVKDPVDTLQALVYVIYYAYVAASMAEMWVFLGKACRLVILLGWNRLDGHGAPSPYSPKAANDEQMEERRRVVWILFLLDRAMSCMTGWPLALDDRQYVVNYPMTEAPYQEGEFTPVVTSAFSMNLAKLLCPEVTRAESSKDYMSLVFRGYALLGRILTYHNLVHRDEHPQAVAAEFSELENVITRFYLITDQETSELPLQDRCVEAWLSILIMTCTIFLYHPTVDAPGVEKAAGERDPAAGFRRCINAARKIIERIREEAMCSMETLINPLLLPSYFLACRFLTITWYETSGTRDRNSIDTMLMLIDRIGNRYGPLALKYRKIIEADLNRDPEAIRKLRRGTGSYLSQECCS